MRNLTLLLLVAAFASPVLFAADKPADEKGSAAAVEVLGARLTRNAEGQVVAVDLRGTWPTDADLESLSHFPRLERINLAYTKVGDEGLERLKPLENVKVLDLYYAESVTDLGIAHLKHWKNLEYLNARGTKVTSTLFEHVAKMTKLKFLDVGHSRVNDDLFENLADLDQLEHLGFGGNKMSGVSLPLLKQLPALRELDVAGQQRTDSGLWSVAVNDFNIEQIAQLDQLEVLDLGETGLTDRGLAKLAALKNLKVLDLRRTRVTSKGLAALVGLPNLQRLRLSQVRGIDDAAIPALLKLEKLEVLELTETGITAVGLEQLQAKRGLKQLLIGGVNVTIEQVEAARTAMPETLVSWWVKPKIEMPAQGRRGGQ